MAGGCSSQVLPSTVLPIRTSGKLTVSFTVKGGRSRQHTRAGELSKHRTVCVQRSLYLPQSSTLHSSGCRSVLGQTLNIQPPHTLEVSLLVRFMIMHHKYTHKPLLPRSRHVAGNKPTGLYDQTLNINGLLLWHYLCCGSLSSPHVFYLYCVFIFLTLFFQGMDIAIVT